jgi:hypothetical protein
MKKYIGAVLSIGTLAMLFYTLFDLKNQVKQISVLQHQLDVVTAQRDSLHDEDFAKSVELGRYELTLDYLQEKNPKAALQFVNYMSHETE